jgi:endonuclease/exonuclease/phosphatase family metal-dependent hydrolase
MRTAARWIGRLLTAVTALVVAGSLIDPRTFWLPASFGPVSPLLLFLTTFLLLALAYRREWKEAIFPLLVVLFAWPSWQKTIAINLGTDEVAKTEQEEQGAGDEDQTANEQARLSTTLLITANLATLKSPEDNYPINAAAITTLGERIGRADFLMVQEFGYPADDEKTQRLRKAGGYVHVMKAKAGNMAIFSNHPLTHVKERFKYNIVNGFLVVDAQTPTGTVRLINFHLHSNKITRLANSISKEGKIRDSGTWQKLRSMFGRYGRASALRSEQAEAIAKAIADSPYPCLVAGDMNDVPTSFPYRLLSASGAMTDSWIAAGNGLGKTFDGALPGLRIDYVFVDPLFTVGSVERLPSGHSDHHPLRVALVRAE